jgi:hypothetical protein
VGAMQDCTVSHVLKRQQLLYKLCATLWIQDSTVENVKLKTMDLTDNSFKTILQ